MTIDCNYSISWGRGERIGAVWWMQNGSIITYHPAEAQIDVAFKGQTQSFSEQPDNCSLQLAALCPEGQGTNWVWIQKGCGSERQLSSGSMQQYVMGK